MTDVHKNYSIKHQLFQAASDLVTAVGGAVEISKKHLAEQEDQSNMSSCFAGNTSEAENSDEEHDVTFLPRCGR